jgi:Uma2 family endonuclease
MAQRVAAPATSGERRLRMSYEEWLAWAPAQEVRSEWVDGEVIVFMPTTLRHGLIAGFVYRLLAAYVEFLDLGVVMESIHMRLADAGRVPDVLFVGHANRDRLTNQRLTGPADLVVEVISDDSVERDTVDRLAEYAAAGVPEHWLLDGRAGQEGARFFRLVGGRFQEAFAEADGRYHSTVVTGFWLRPEWLRQDPLPNALTCLAAIAPDAVRAALAAPDQPGGLDQR